MTNAPHIVTQRLTLRPHVPSDFAAMWDFFQNSDRAKHMLAPRDKNHLWYGMGSEIASWSLFGFGAWGIENRDGAFVGQVAITHPPFFPEPEIGWTLMDGFQGQGFAFEAAHAALSWAAKNTALNSLVSYIAPANTRSIALATRLGAVHDANARGFDETTVVYRHDVGAFK